MAVVVVVDTPNFAAFVLQLRSRRRDEFVDATCRSIPVYGRRSFRSSPFYLKLVAKRDINSPFRRPTYLSI